MGSHHRRRAGRVQGREALPGGGCAWDWNETGTRHRPGVQIADAEAIVEAGATTIVLSRGMDLVLQVPAETVAALQARGIRVHALETRRAVELYNRLAEDTAVGALFHSTC